MYRRKQYVYKKSVGLDYNNYYKVAKDIPRQAELPKLGLAT